MASNPGRERRMRVRVWVDATASVTPVPNPPPHRVWNLVGEDISEAGIRLLSPESFPVKSRLRLEVYPEDQGLPVLTIGEVVWIEQFPEASRWRLGVKFSELSEEARAGVRELVRGRPPARH
jgi:hypothetical protein